MGPCDERPEKGCAPDESIARLPRNRRPGDRDAYEQRLRDDLKFLNYAPIVFVSANTGKGVERIFPLIEKVAAERLAHLRHRRDDRHRARRL